MGASKSKPEDDEEFVFDKKYIAWDENGCLIYGLVHPISREKQLREVLNADTLDDEAGKIWYIVSSAWIASWLAYVHIDKGFAPAPGPCRNEHLIEWDYEHGKYVARKGIIISDGERAGDCRRVAVGVWQKFLEYYPGSGPTITAPYDPKNKNDSSNWEIHDPPAPPENKEKKYKKREKLTSIFKRATLKPNAEDEHADSALLKSEGDDQSPRPSEEKDTTGDGVRNEPKLVPFSVNYAKKTDSDGNSVGKVGDGKGSISKASSENESHESVAQKRESFFENVYFSKD